MATINDVTEIPLSGENTVDSLLSDGPSWNYLTPNPNNVLYYTFAYDGVSTSGVSSVSIFNATQKSVTRDVIAYVETVTGIDFVETSSATLGQFAFLSANIAGSSVAGLTSWKSSYSYTTGDIITSYDADAKIFLDVFDFSKNLNPVAGTSGYEVLLHEFGHALGLKHPFEDSPQLPSSLDDTNHTLMSYTEAGDPKTTFQEFDLAALSWIYGGDGLGASYGINSTFGPSLTQPVSDTTAPTVTSFNPSDGASGFDVSQNIVFTFSEAIQRGTGNVVLKTTGGSVVATYNAATSSNIAISGTTLTLNPSSNLAYNTGYSVEFSASTVKDLAGNSYAGTSSYNFATASDPVNQTFIGTFANETFTGGIGNDTIDGQGGLDVATYSLQKSNYAITQTASGFTVKANLGTEGTDTLSNIERLSFADKRVALDLTPEGNAGKAIEFIGMLAYSLITSPSVIANVLSVFDQGKSMFETCQLALNIGLIRDLAGSSSNLDLANLVYRNVIGSEASAADANSLSAYIQGSGGLMTQADFLATVAQLELNQSHVNLVGLQSTGVEYLA